MNTNTSRVPAGVSTGGQFATSSHGEATGVQLHSNVEREILRERLNAVLDRTSMQGTAGVDPGPDEAAALRAVGVAAAVRMHYPNAASVEIEEMYDPGSTAMSIQTVLDADGDDVSEGWAELGDEDDAVSQLLVDALDSIPYGSVNGLEIIGRAKHGHKARIHIDAVLDGALPEKKPAPGEVGAQTIAAFRARHGDTDADEVGSARDLLTELHHWARAGGHDLQALVAAAGEVADEESALRQDEETSA
ncbi:hypothetical protein [Cellulosimicrobium sp. Marseille-Q4280]|uniref:hypothetical protein n=1 Tax=Cellulosimicrobium sp. Marseille-Q4280 TaxID=2937992 RepID=UPI002041962C|nr:hypothetical protein [Cellulosimicrobium sp. Marseille-Q4280]